MKYDCLTAILESLFDSLVVFLRSIEFDSVRFNVLSLSILFSFGGLACLYGISTRQFQRNNDMISIMRFGGRVFLPQVLLTRVLFTNFG